MAERISRSGVTIYCTECEGPADVVDEFEDDDDTTFVRYWVRVLDCGHEEATQR